MDKSGLGDYEKEKLELTKSQLQRLADMIDLMIKMLDYCESKDINVNNRPSFEKLRSPDGLAGPESNMAELEVKLEKTQLSVLKMMSENEIKKMEETLGLKFISEKEIRKSVKVEQAKGYNG